MPPKDQKMPFLSLVTLTFDVQTRPTEGPNTSSAWIWCKPVQLLPRYFIRKRKKLQTNDAKNRTFCSSLHVVKKDYHWKLGTSA